MERRLERALDSPTFLAKGPAKISGQCAMCDRLINRGLYENAETRDAFLNIYMYLRYPITYFDLF